MNNPEVDRLVSFLKYILSSEHKISKVKDKNVIQVVYKPIGYSSETQYIEVKDKEIVVYISSFLLASAMMLKVPLISAMMFKSIVNLNDRPLTFTNRPLKNEE